MKITRDRIFEITQLAFLLVCLISLIMAGLSNNILAAIWILISTVYCIAGLFLHYTIKTWEKIYNERNNKG